MQINITGGKNTKVCSFDVDEETRRHEPWTGSAQHYKQNLDAFLNGGVFNYPSGSGESYDYSKSGTKGFIKNYRNKKFIENLGEYTYNANSEETNDSGHTFDYTDSTTLVKNKKKRVIIYTLLN